MAAEEVRVFQNIDRDNWGAGPTSPSPLGPALALIGFVGLCLLAGGAGAALTSRSIESWYDTLNKPPLTPPREVFGPVWGTLYVMMGVAGWMVWRRCGGSRPLRVWGWQLALNAAWAPIFFRLRSPLLAFAVLITLIGVLLQTIRSFWSVDRPAAWLMVPYAAWTFFAVYLNAGFVWLNPFHD